MALQDRLVRSATLAWADPHRYLVPVVNLWPLVERGNRLAIAARLMRETERALRPLFATNRQWEPDWKWLAPESNRLRSRPPRPTARVDEIFTPSDPRESAVRCLRLILDVLELAPDRHDLDRQKRLVQEALLPEERLRDARWDEPGA